jgi:hypothetical protein
MEAATYDLNGLRAVLEIREGREEVRYHIELDPERKDALIERSVEGGGQSSCLLTLEQLRGMQPHDCDWARSDVVVWAARGLWGVPLRFGPKEAPPKSDPVDFVKAESPKPKRAK